MQDTSADDQIEATAQLTSVFDREVDFRLATRREHGRGFQPGADTDDQCRTRTPDHYSEHMYSHRPR